MKVDLAWASHLLIPTNTLLLRPSVLFFIDSVTNKELFHGPGLESESEFLLHLLIIGLLPLDLFF